MSPERHCQSRCVVLRGAILCLLLAFRFEYNPAGDLTKVIDALLNETRFGTDGAGRRVAATDPLRNTTLIAHNGIDQVTRITDARSQQTNLAYDPAGRLESVTNARSFAVERYGYDSGDRLKTRTDAKNRQTLYDYDSAGRLERMTERRGLVSTYAYDAQDRVVEITRSDGVTQISYDTVGRLTEITDPAGTLSYAYDAVDRVIRETQATGAVTSIVEYAYDALDRRTSRTLVGVPGEVTTYGYDRANRLTSIGYRGETTTLEYDAAGRLTLKVLPNGIRQVFAYDEADRLLSIAYTHPDETPLEQIAYTYDAAGRRLSDTRSTGTLAESAFTAAYDEADRMVALTLTGGGQSFVLSYDDSGNLAQKTETTAPSNVTTYTWDSRNRLSAISGPGINASFEYDALDRRIARTVNGQTTRYVYDGLQALGEVVNGEQTGLLTGLNLDEAIARYTSQGARVYLTDALNTVLAQTRADRSIQNYYAYSPYGEASSLGPDEGNSIQYTARENDRTGLYYYRARYYDPVLKRFVSEDPVGLLAGPNFYSYTGGDPINWNDPTGHHPGVLIGALLGGVAGGVGAALQGGNATQILVGVGVGVVGGAVIGIFPAAGLVNTLGAPGLALFRGGAGAIGNTLGQVITGVSNAPPGSPFDACFRFNFGALAGATIGAATFGTLTTQVTALLGNTAGAGTRLAFGFPGALGQGTATAIGGAIAMPQSR